MYFIDTHIVVWLYQKSLEYISTEGRNAINGNDIFISPIVILELQYLYEIERINENTNVIIDYLKNKIDLKIDNGDFKSIVNISLKETWTRDPFDRIIVSHAKYKDAFLITADKIIKKNYYKTI